MYTTDTAKPSRIRKNGELKSPAAPLETRIKKFGGEDKKPQLNIRRGKGGREHQRGKTVEVSVNDELPVTLTEGHENDKGRRNLITSDEADYRSHLTVHSSQGAH